RCLGFLGIRTIHERTTEYTSQSATTAGKLLQVGAVPHGENLVTEPSGVIFIAKAPQLNNPGTLQRAGKLRFFRGLNRLRSFRLFNWRLNGLRFRARCG